MTVFGNGTAAGARILVVDDDRACAELIGEVMRDAGHQVRTLGDARAAVQTAAAWRPDVVILDVMMPFIDGYSVCLGLRRSVDAQVLIVSAKGDACDRTMGIRLGADDYLSKPFDTNELEARVAALVRRRRTAALEPERKVGNVTLYRTQKRATIDGRPLSLTATELRLLERLTDDLGRVFSREELVHEVWNDRLREPGRAVDVQMGRLRRKLEQAGAKGLTLDARRGFGYVALGEAGVEIPLLPRVALSAA